MGFEPTTPCGEWCLRPSRIPFRHFGSARDIRVRTGSAHASDARLARRCREGSLALPRTGGDSPLVDETAPRSDASLPTDQEEAARSRRSRAHAERVADPSAIGIGRSSRRALGATWTRSTAWSSCYQDYLFALTVRVVDDREPAADAVQEASSALPQPRPLPWRLVPQLADAHRAQRGHGRPARPQAPTGRPVPGVGGRLLAAAGRRGRRPRAPGDRAAAQPRAHRRRWPRSRTTSAPAIVLYDVEGYDYQEIADMTGRLAGHRQVAHPPRPPGAARPAGRPDGTSCADREPSARRGVERREPPDPPRRRMPSTTALVARAAQPRRRPDSRRQRLLAPLWRTARVRQRWPPTSSIRYATAVLVPPRGRATSAYPRQARADPVARVFDRARSLASPRPPAAASARRRRRRHRPRAGRGRTVHQGLLAGAGTRRSDAAAARRRQCDHGVSPSRRFTSTMDDAAASPRGQRSRSTPRRHPVSAARATAGGATRRRPGSPSHRQRRRPGGQGHTRRTTGACRASGAGPTDADPGPDAGAGPHGRRQSSVTRPGQRADSADTSMALVLLGIVLAGIGLLVSAADVARAPWRRATRCSGSRAAGVAVASAGRRPVHSAPCPGSCCSTRTASSTAPISRSSRRR